MKVKYYLAYIDILGFDKLPEEIAGSNWSVDHVRNNYFLIPVTKVLDPYNDKEIISFTDNFLILSTKYE